MDKEHGLSLELEQGQNLKALEQWEVIGGVYTGE